MVKEDYTVRMIKDMVRFLGGLIIGRRDINYELPDDTDYTKEDYLYKQIMSLLDAGKINEAENLLLDALDPASDRYFELALDFYQKLSEYDDEYLEEHNYSKEEVQDGLMSVARAFGVKL